MKFDIRSNPSSKKTSKWLIIAALLIGTVCGVTAGSVFVLTRDLPQIAALEGFRPAAVTRVYSADRILLAEFYAQRRDPVDRSRIPDDLVTALLTIEDRRFYQHSGIAVRGIVRAIVKNVMEGGYAEGASTITQQLAKTLFLNPRKTIIRKMREAILALQLEQRYTKDEILTFYLNQVYFGSGAYGAAAAAQTYFNRPIDTLTVAQCALLAGLLKAPSRYSPLIHPDLALQRRNLVLAQMLATAAIDKPTYQLALQEPIQTAPARADTPHAPYFIDFVKTDLELMLGADQVYKGGLTVTTTLSAHLQTAAEQAVAAGIDRLTRRMQPNTPASDAPQAALLAIDIHTGGIIAMVGGNNYEKSKYNRSVTALRQPGSAFKPLVYALAIERGFNQNETLLDAPIIFQQGVELPDWQPENFSKTYSGEVSLRYALAQSKNIPAVRLIEIIGPSSVVQFAHSLGISSHLHPGLSLALGTSEVSLLELTAAYAAFADRGTYTRPFGISEVRDQKGSMLWTVKPEQHIALSRTAAAVITDMLTEVMHSGTGRTTDALPGPLAGKTGTTDKFKDALFIGYSPHTIAGVWVGKDGGASLGPDGTGSRAALPIWLSFMQTALTAGPPAYFDVPDSVRQVYMDLKSGRPLSADLAGVRVMIRK